MTAEDKPGDRGTIPTVATTAAVTVAIGITAAALGGYFVPPSSDKKATAEPVTVVETPPQVEPSAPKVVFVPIVPDSPVPEVVVASNAATDDKQHDDDHHAKHRERAHEDDHDDDDD